MIPPWSRDYTDFVIVVAWFGQRRTVLQIEACRHRQIAGRPADPTEALS
jgi:hypothetical protein